MGPRHAARDLPDREIFEMAKREDLGLPVAQRREAFIDLIDRALEIQIVFGSAGRHRKAGAQQLISHVIHALLLRAGAAESSVHPITRASVDTGQEWCLAAICGERAK
jgi:hypothetical protein